MHCLRKAQTKFLHAVSQHILPTQLYSRTLQLSKSIPTVKTQQDATVYQTFIIPYFK